MFAFVLLACKAELNFLYCKNSIERKRANLVGQIIDSDQSQKN